MPIAVRLARLAPQGIVGHGQGRLHRRVHGPGSLRRSTGLVVAQGGFRAPGIFGHHRQVAGIVHVSAGMGERVGPAR